MRKVLLALALALSLAACGKKLPIPPPPPPPPPGQSDTTRVVLAEIFSARLCSNCPRADSALQALAEANGPQKLVTLEYHPTTFSGQRDSLGTVETDARKTYYNVTTFPACFFDGLHKTLGAPINVYEVYRDSLSVESARRSPVSLGITASPSGLATVTIKALSDLPTPLVLHTVVASDSVYYHTPFKDWWQFVVLDMIPDASGDTLQVAVGDSLTKVKGFTIQPNWVPGRLYVLAFLQNPANREILQSAQVKLIP